MTIFVRKLNQENLTVFYFENYPIRVKYDFENPGFVAQDVYAALGISNHQQELFNYDADDKDEFTINDTVQKKSIKYIVLTESGLYRTIFSSSKPQAENFKKWIFSQVIPNIRKSESDRLANKKADFNTPEVIQKSRSITLLDIKSALELAVIRGESSRVTESEFFVIAEINARKILTLIGKIISGNEAYEATFDDIWDLIIKINEREDILKSHKRDEAESPTIKGIIDLHLFGKQHKLSVFYDYLEGLRVELESIYMEIKRSPVKDLKCNTSTKEIIQYFLASIPPYVDEEQQQDESHKSHI